MTMLAFIRRLFCPPTTTLTARVFVSRDRIDKPGNILAYVKSNAVEMIAAQLAASEGILKMANVEEVEDGKLYTVELEVIGQR